jgi:2-desacetyl-2-hydroxyethyl bacteriochlorophyllide A dehydrogenase
MTAAVLTGIDRPLQVRDVPYPTLVDGSVVVRVRAAGVCHTDLHLCEGVPADPPLPLVLGHEIAGEVAEVGANVSGRRVGDRVLVYYYDGCGTCEWCAVGDEQLCATPRAKWGFDTDGGFAEYIAVPARCVVALPDGCSFAEAATLGCAGTTAVHVAHDVAAVAHGEVVVVVGAGGVGLACVQVAKAAGARVIAVDPAAASRAAAQNCGAEAVVDPRQDDPVRVVAELTGGRGSDVVVDTVGDDRTPGQCVAMARRRGRVVLVGYDRMPAPLDLMSVIGREVRVLGSVGATLANARTAVELVARGQLRGWIDTEMELSAAPDALARLRGAGVVGRIVLVP